MIPGEITGIQYYLSPDENPVPLPGNNFGMIHDDMPNFHLNRLLSNLPNSLFLPPGSHESMTTQSSNLSNNSSTSDEAEEQKLTITDERKQRRMISNRESARRSRMRKQRHLDELCSQVVRLRAENHNLIHKLYHVSECHDRVVQENARLKEETSDLRQMLSELQISIPCTNASLRELEKVPSTQHISELNPQGNLLQIR